MRKSLVMVLPFALGIFLTSCSNKLVGTWNVDSYEVTKQGQQGAILKNVGTITLNKNGTASRNLDLSFLTNQTSNEVPLKWTSIKGETVTLTGEDKDFAKTWIIIKDNRKTQKWKATDGANGVQTLELSKK